MTHRTDLVTYEQLLTIKQCLNSRDPMVFLEEYFIKTKPWSNDMLPYTGENIFVRRLVADKLQRINQKLQTELQMELLVTYGYRHQDIQKKYFDECCEKERTIANEKLFNEWAAWVARLSRGPMHGPKKITDEELYPIVHNFIAVPSVAGHPTGGAVDVTLLHSGVEVDMGTKIADFSDPLKLPTFADCITEEQRKNRLILREYMLLERFAPFNGEWWHFSFGDKEWAYWYEEEIANYSQIEFTFKNVNG